MRDLTAQWLASADEDWAGARMLLDANLRRSCVFHVHLAVEKTPKALVVEVTGRQPPLTHRLEHLARLTGLDFPPRVLAILVNLSPQSVISRYDLSPELYDLAQ